MMIRKTFEYLGSGILVYFGVAACSGSGAIDSLMEATGGIFGSGASKSSDGLGGATGGIASSGGDGSGATSVGSGAEGSGAVMGSGASQGSGSAMATGATGGGGGSLINPVPKAKAEDGTRILNLYRSTADGLKTPEGYWDKELGIRCVFGVAEDRLERCTPLSTVQAGSYYSDASCSTTVAAVQKTTCLSSEYAYSVTFHESCSGSQSYYSYSHYKIGQKLSGPTIYVGDTDNCAEVTQSTYDTYDFYGVSKVDPSVFAEGTLVQGGG